jgi:hypothetical protein
MIFTENISSRDRWWIEKVEEISKCCMCDCIYQNDSPQCSIIFGPLCGAWEDLKEKLEEK